MSLPPPVRYTTQARRHPTLLWRHGRLSARAVWSETALLLSLAVIAGVAAGTGSQLLPAPLLVILVAGGAGMAVVSRNRRAVWFPALLVAALALGLWRGADARPPSGPGGLAFYEGRTITLAGTVMAEPEALDRGENIRLSAGTLAPARHPAHSVSGGVLVHLPQPTTLRYGDRITVQGTLEAPPELPGTQPGSYRAYLAAQGVDAVLNYPRWHLLTSGGGNVLVRLALALRQALEGGIGRALPDPERAVLLGILLGTRTRALGPLTAPYVATGMIHIIAIDGFKVSLVVGFVHVLARRLLGARRALPATLAALVLYVLSTGATPAGLRAGVMWGLALLAVRFGRRSDAPTSLALAAALLAFVSPRILSDLGFQLSLGGTAGIILLSERVQHLLRHLPPILREGLAVSLAAQLGTLPFLAAGFGQISLIAPLANAVLLPLLAPIMILGLIAALAGALVPALGPVAGWPVYPFLAVLDAAVSLLARLPLAAVAASGWPLPLVAAYYPLAGLLARLFRPAPRQAGAPSGPRPLHLALATGGGIALILAVVAWQAPRPAYTLAVLPLGGGQGVLLTAPGGQTLLVDGGDTPRLLDTALGTRLPFWRSRIDTLVLTATDRSHADGLRALTAHYTVGQALDPGAIYPPAGYALWRAELRTAGVPERKLRSGERVSIDSTARIDALLPPGLDPENPETPVALRLVAGRFSLLMLNRAAVYADPAALQADGIRHDTALLLPAGTDDPHDAVPLLRIVRPRLVILPSPDDPRDDPSADALVRRAARSLGIQVWQSDGSSALHLVLNPSVIQGRTPAG